MKYQAKLDYVKCELQNYSPPGITFDSFIPINSEVFAIIIDSIKIMNSDKYKKSNKSSKSDFYYKVKEICMEITNISCPLFKNGFNFNFSYMVYQGNYRFIAYYKVTLKQ